MRAPHSVRKWKDIMRFEIRYFFSGRVKPKGLACYNYSGEILLQKSEGGGSFSYTGGDMMATENCFHRFPPRSRLGRVEYS